MHRLYETVLTCLTSQKGNANCNNNHLELGLEGMDEGLDYLCKQNKQGRKYM